MKSKKKESMQIKRPSLKGMKNTKYLGHFAQDKYIQKGHNLSGVFDVYRPPSAIELMAPANPFSAVEERKRRLSQVGQTEQFLATLGAPEEMLAQEQQLNQQAAEAEAKAAQYETPVQDAYGRMGVDIVSATKARRERVSAGTKRFAANLMGKYGRAKKFVSEL